MAKKVKNVGFLVFEKVGKNFQKTNKEVTQKFLNQTIEDAVREGTPGVIFMLSETHWGAALIPKKTWESIYSHSHGHMEEEFFKILNEQCSPCGKCPHPICAILRWSFLFGEYHG